MSDMVNLVRVLTAATGTGTMTLGAAYSQLFMTAAEAGAVDGRTYSYLIVEGNNWELGEGVYTASGTTLSRVTVLASRIAGTLGTTKVTLTGTAQVRFLYSAKDIGALRGTRGVGSSPDVIAQNDLGRHIVYNSASAVAVSIAQAGTAGQFLDGWCCYVENINTGLVTITPTVSLINGAATLDIPQNHGAVIYSNNGSSYRALFMPVTKPLLAGNNLSDLASVATARQTLGVGNTGMHNRIINGRCNVDQRFSGGSTTLSDNNYWADRWRGLTETASHIYTARDTTMGGGRLNGKIAFQSGTDKGGVWQPIEGINCKDLRGKSVTLSVALQVSNTRLGNIKMGIVEFTGTEDSVSGDPVSSWGADGVTPTLAANYAFINTPANLSVTTSDVNYSTTVTLGSSFNNLAVFIWNDDKTFTNGDALYFSDVQLEQGASKTNYAKPSTAQEWTDCTYYFRKRVAASNNDPFTVLHAWTTSRAWGAIENWLSPMRVAPTASLSALGDFKCWDQSASGSASPSSVTFSTSRYSVGFNDVTLASAILSFPGQATQFSGTISGTAALSYNAEL